MDGCSESARKDFSDLNLGNEGQEEEIDYDEMEGWQVAAEGIKLALNNRVEDAQALFNNSQTPCVHKRAGYCYLTFINAVMTFEEDKMALALSTLKEMEKRCSSDLSWSPSFSSIHQSVKSRLWNFSSTNDVISHQDVDDSSELKDANNKVALKLEQQIIIADCQVLAAIINFLHQDWGSYMKGGWVLRKAWKIYQKAYSQIRELYMKRVGLNSNTLAPPPPSNQVMTPESKPSSFKSRNNGTGQQNNPKKIGSTSSAGSSSAASSGSSGSSPAREIPSIGSTKNYRGIGSRVSHSLSVPLNLFSLVKSDSTAQIKNEDAEFVAPSATDLLPPSTVKRLMSAVSFGYGIFHLAVSLLPPKLLNIIHFLGFEGDRTTGIQALHFSRQGNDMRGPIATLALLWFHTIVRPFYGLDGSNLRAGANAAQRLIDSSKPDFAKSALFLFFQGRVDRLKCNFTEALNSYELALAVSAQREVRLLCLHEVGWSYVLLLQWEKSSSAFLQLKRESRWSKSFYCYLSAICLGCCGQMARSLRLAEETPSLVRSSNNQLERFLLRRATKMIADEPDRNYCLLLGYELLYLWNALGACLKHSHASIQIDCERINVPALEGVRRLILGSVYSNAGQILRAKNHYLGAIKEGESSGDNHTSAFASYELGMLLCKKADDKEMLDEGMHHLANARDNYHNYDFENRLCVRIHSALRYYSAVKLPSKATEPGQ